MSLTPRPYQLVGRDFLASRSRALLADQMRVGKTPQAILAAEHAGFYAILVLCPAIAVPHWQREFKRWWPTGMENMPLVEFYSYDKARTLWQAGDLKGKKWDVLIVDEAHFCKNPEAARTQMVYGKGGLGYQAGAIWALSGTPAPKHAGELWPMLRAFGATDLSHEAFVRRYCSGYVDRHRWHRPFVVTGTREDRIPELRALLAPIMLRRTRKDVAPDMPEIDFQFLEVEPVRGVDLLAPTALYDDAELLEEMERHPAAHSDSRRDVALAKVVPLADEIDFAIKNNLLKQTVVFGWHTAPLEELCDRLFLEKRILAKTITGKTPRAESERRQAGFRNGEIQVICANILAAGTAIDLSAASHGYFLELDWVPGNNLQAANRLVSMEKEEPVSFDVVTWRGSTDDRVQQVLVRRVRELSQLM